MYNNSKIILRKTCQILRNCQCKGLLASLSAPGNSVGSSGFPEKFLLDKGKIVSIGWPNLVPQQRIDDYVMIHILHWGLCDPLLSNHQSFATPDTTVPVRLVQEALVIFVLKQVSQFRSFGKWVKMLCLLGTTFAPKVIHEKNWKHLDVLEHFHQPIHPWTPVALPAHLATHHSVIPRRHFYLDFRFFCWFMPGGSSCWWVLARPFTSTCCWNFRVLSQFPAMKM